MQKGTSRNTVIAFLTILLFAGCGSLMATPIKKILENPRVYNGTSVTVSGEVTELFSLIVIKYFVVKDSTGEIVVVRNMSMTLRHSLSAFSVFSPHSLASVSAY